MKWAPSMSDHMWLISWRYLKDGYYCWSACYPIHEIRGVQQQAFFDNNIWIANILIGTNWKICREPWMKPFYTQIHIKQPRFQFIITSTIMLFFLHSIETYILKILTIRKSNKKGEENFLERLYYWHKRGNHFFIHIYDWEWCITGKFFLFCN